MKKDITELFCIIDDFCKLYEKYRSKKLLPSGNMIRDRHSKMGLSEMLTIIIYSKLPCNPNNGLSIF